MTILEIISFGNWQIIGIQKVESTFSKESTRVSWADMKKRKFQRLSKKIKNVAKAVEKKKRKTVYKQKRHTLVDDLNERYLVGTFK